MRKDKFQAEITYSSAAVVYEAFHNRKLWQITIYFSKVNFRNYFANLSFF